jgi:hypothetical protein
VVVILIGALTTGSVFRDHVEFIQGLTTLPETQIVGPVQPIRVQCKSTLIPKRLPNLFLRLYIVIVSGES